MANGRKYRMYRWLAAVAIMATVTGLSACGGRPADGRAGPATLKVAVSAVSPTAIELYVAAQNGLFQKRGLAVQVDHVGTNYTTLVVSGGADIAYGGIQGPINLQGRGKDAVVVEGQSGGGTGGTLVGTPQVATLADLAKLPDCRIGASAKGSNGWGYAQIYAASVGAKCDVIPFSDLGSALAALSSGRVDALASSPMSVVDMVKQGKATMLVDTRNANDFRKYVPTPFLENSYWGIRDNLNKKRDAVRQFTDALAEARQWIDAKSDQDVAQVLLAYGNGFAEIGSDTLIASLPASRVFRSVGNDHGKVTDDQWRAAVEGQKAIQAITASADQPSMAHDHMFFDSGKATGS